MKVIPFIYNDIEELFANTYLVVDDSLSCVVIDPSKDNDKIVNYIKEHQFVPKAVLLTHTHFDHLRGAQRLVDAFNIPVYVGYDDEIGLRDQDYNLSSFMGLDITVKCESKTVLDNDIIHLLDEDIKVIYTPYHTLGGVCFYLEKSKLLFTGDSLFEGSIGRDDFPCSNPRLKESSLEKFKTLDDDIKIYPGHGGLSSIGREKLINPFLR